MSILKLKPSCKDYIWGGSRLKKEYGIGHDGEVLAEAWELSCHPDGPSYLVNSRHAGKTLQQYIDEEGKEVLGTHCRRFRDFPILTKMHFYIMDSKRKSAGKNLQGGFRRIRFLKCSMRCRCKREMYCLSNRERSMLLERIS